MEKVIWVTSTKKKDGLDTVNIYLENGWKVKMISACSVNPDVSGSDAQAYIVLEKDS